MYYKVVVYQMTRSQVACWTLYNVLVSQIKWNSKSLTVNLFKGKAMDSLVSQGSTSCISLHPCFTFLLHGFVHMCFGNALLWFSVPLHHLFKILILFLLQSLFLLFQFLLISFWIVPVFYVTLFQMC